MQTLVKQRRSRGSLSKNEILEAALALLEEGGVSNLSMRAIAKRLGCSVASPYTHFKSQREIMQELILRSERRLARELRRARASSDDVFEQLEAIAHTYYDFARSNAEVHRVLFTLEAQTIQRELFPILPTSYRIFLETIRAGVLQGKISFSREAYPAIARTMWAWLYGLIVTELTNMNRRPTTAQTTDPVSEGIHFYQILLKRGESPLENVGGRLKNLIKR